MINLIKKNKNYEPVKSLVFNFINSLKRVENKFNSKNRKCARILTYHRIINIINDPTRLAVSPGNFEDHIVFLKQNFQILPLVEVCKRVRDKKIEGNEVAITFDDGYEDNLINALPVLDKRNIPATIFISTGNLGGSSNHDWDLGYSDENKARILSREQILLLSDSNFEIGGHTENHKSLGNLKIDEQVFEVETNKEKLEEILGKKIFLFAYPFGEFNNINNDSVKTIKRFYDFAFLNNNRLVTNSSDLYKIPRINIQNQSVDKFKKTIFYE